MLLSFRFAYVLVHLFVYILIGVYDTLSGHERERCTARIEPSLVQLLAFNSSQNTYPRCMVAEQV